MKTRAKVSSCSSVRRTVEHLDAEIWRSSNGSILETGLMHQMTIAGSSRVFPGLPYVALRIPGNLRVEKVRSSRAGTGWALITRIRPCYCLLLRDILVLVFFTKQMSWNVSISS